MSIGASLFLIAAGAILRYAITWNPRDVNIDTVGLILMIVGSSGCCCPWCGCSCRPIAGGRARSRRLRRPRLRTRATATPTSS